jgi:hypothetical protein
MSILEEQETSKKIDMLEKALVQGRFGDGLTVEISEFLIEDLAGDLASELLIEPSLIRIPTQVPS